MWTAGSDGSGSWQTSASSKKELYTGSISDLASCEYVDYKYQYFVNREFDIEYILSSKGTSITSSFAYTGRVTIPVGQLYTTVDETWIGCVNFGTVIGHILFANKTVSVKIGSNSATQLTSDVWNIEEVDSYKYRLYV